MNIVAYGAGTDSTAVLCGWAEKKMQDSNPIELILFADTGGERPHTYEYLAVMSNWLRRNGFPDITVVKKGGKQETLEENCLRMSMLPSLAYGRKGCSHKYKIEPQEKFCRNYPPTKALLKSGGKINKLIGYEWAEKRRWAKAKLEDDHYTYQFPLVEWEWSRPECLEAIQRAGLPLPRKSACFFCPASKKPEIISLKEDYPDLFQRALAIEAKAMPNLKSVKGLGRSFNWEEFNAGLPTEEEVLGEGCLWCSDD